MVGGMARSRDGGSAEVNGRAEHQRQSRRRERWQRQTGLEIKCIVDKECVKLSKQGYLCSGS